MSRSRSGSKSVSSPSHTFNDQLSYGNHVVWVANISSVQEHLVRSIGSRGKQCSAFGGYLFKIVFGPRNDASKGDPTTKGWKVSSAAHLLRLNTYTLAPSDAYRFAKSSPHPELAPMIRTLSLVGLITLVLLGGAGDTRGVNRRIEGIRMASVASHGAVWAELGGGMRAGRC